MAKQESRSGMNWVGAAIVGAALFAALLIFTGNFPLAVVGGLAGMIAGVLIFKPQPKTDIRLMSSGVSQEMVDSAIKEGKAMVAHLRLINARIGNPLVQFKVKQIAEVADKILEDIRQDPADLKAARPFLNYYLDATVKILERYAEISAKKVLDADVMKSLKRVEDLLDSIRLSFHKQLARLQENDMLDLDTEMSVLEKSIQLDMGELGTIVEKKGGTSVPLA